MLVRTYHRRRCSERSLVIIRRQLLYGSPERPDRLPQLTGRARELLGWIGGLHLTHKQINFLLQADDALRKISLLYDRPRELEIFVLREYSGRAFVLQDPAVVCYIARI